MTNKRTMIFAAGVSIIGAISMLTGAAFWGASGTDLWQALVGDQMESYLSGLPSVRQLLVINTSFWILGVLLMATAVTIMAGFNASNSGLAQMAKVVSTISASVAIVSFVMMLSLAIVIPPIELATIIGWIGTRLDDIATILIIGFSPFCLSIVGKGEWVPGWLAIWGYLAGIAGLLGILGLLTNNVAMGTIIIPIGVGWMLAAGIALLKKSRTVVS